MRQVSYSCRDIGYGIEEGTARGDWAERDWTGKRRFHVAAPSAEGSDLYLFDDEIISDVQVGCWIAGYNMPGYLPEMEPAAFETFDEARRFIIDEMERAADACDERARMDNDGSEEAKAYEEADHDEAESLSSAAEDLNLASEGDWGITVGNCAYWITFDSDATTDDEL